MINYLKVKGIVSEQEVPIVLYGLKLLLVTLVELVSVVLLAAWCGNIFEGIFFLLGFCPLRLYAGGYHAKTSIRCYFTMLAVYTVFSFFLMITPTEMYHFIEWTVGIFTFCTIYRFAPIIHKNKITHPDEIPRYRRISINICLLALLLLAVGEVIAPANVYGFAFSIGLAVVSFSMMVEVGRQ